MFVQKFYIADTHFRHERILTLQPRPFPSIDAHDNAIVERWNAVVRDHDIVYVYHPPMTSAAAAALFTGAA